GLWATITPVVADPRRRVGSLSPEPALLGSGLSGDEERILEVLYCECCGTQLLCGDKTPVKLPKSGNGVPGCGGGGTACFELTSLPTRIEGMPEATPSTRTDAQTYEVLGVVWLAREQDDARPDDVSWDHGSILESGPKGRPGKPRSTVPARWAAARIDPRT